jgi:hypothetical protein
MQSYFYLFMIRKFGYETYHYFNRLLITIYFFKKNAQRYFYLFIHIIYAIM